MPKPAPSDTKSSTIVSHASCRVDLAGSTLDLWPLYLFHPGSVTLNAAISLYASCRIETNGGESIRLVSRDIQREESFPCFAALMKTKRYRLPLLAEITSSSGRKAASR